MILGSKDQFVPMVLNGSKTHTIRAGFRWKTGTRADLYTGGYRPGARRLLFRVPVTKVEAIKIKRVLFHNGLSAGIIEVARNGRLLSLAEIEALARHDGFADGLAGMNFYWREEYGNRSDSFTGQLIHWDYERRFEKVEDTWRTCYRVPKWTAQEARKKR